MRIRMRVPAGTLTSLVLCAAGELARAGAVFKPADEAAPREFAGADASAKKIATAQTITCRIPFLSFVAFTSLLQQSAETKLSEDR